MARYKMLVLSRPTSPELEDEYNDWYQNKHLKDIVSVPGFISAQRFKLAVNMLGSDDTYPYIAIYEVETDDVDAAYQELVNAAGGNMFLSPAFHLESVYASIYEPFGEEVVEK